MKTTFGIQINQMKSKVIGWMAPRRAANASMAAQEMKTKIIDLIRISQSVAGEAILVATACLALCAPSVRAQTVTFGFQKGNLTTNSVVLDGAYNVVDGVLSDGNATTILTAASQTAAVGSFFRTGSPNGQQQNGFFAYDLTQLANFITANTSGSSSVSIASVSFTVITASAASTGGGNYDWRIYGTDPFTSSCTWSNYDGINPWTVPYQNLASPNNTVLYGYTGGGSALTTQLNTNTIFLNGVGTASPMTLRGGANFSNAVVNALARTDKTLYLTLRIPTLVNGDSRQTLTFSPTTTVASRPLLQIVVNISVNSGSSAWTGGGGNNSWTTPGNWSPSGVPPANAFINFNNSSIANLSTVLNQDFNVNGINVTNPTGPVSIAGPNSLTINSASGIDLSAATQDLTITAPVGLGANQTWNVGASRTLSIGGAVTGNGNLTIAGAGKVSVGAANVLPSGATAGSLTVNGTLDLKGTEQTINTLSGNGVVDNTAGAVASLTLTNGSFSGTIQNAGGALALVKTSAAGVNLNGANTYSGGTTINGGLITPGNTNAIGTGILTVNSGGIFYPVANLAFTNAVTLNGGTLEIGGANGHVLSFNGPVTVTAASAIKADGSTYGIYLNGGLDMGSGGYTLSCYNGTSGNGNQISGITGASGTILNGSIGNLWITGSNTFAGTFRATNSGPLIFSSVYALQNATLDMNAADIGGVSFSANVIIGALTGSRDLNLGSRAISIGNNNANTLYSGAMTNTGSLTKVGNGTLTLSGANTYPGKTTISAGTLALSGSGSIASADIIVAGGASLDVSALSSAFGLAGRTLTNSSVGAVLNGTNDCTTGTLALVYDGVNPSFIQTNGTMTLSASTVIQVNNTGAPLSTGSHKIIAAATTGNIGKVTGLIPSVTITGNGAAGTATLQFNGSGGLDLVVTTATPLQPVISSIVLSGANLILHGTNGTASATYSIITATNLTTPLVNWTTNISGTLTAGGAFSNAIPLGAEPARFFQIKTP